MEISSALCYTYRVSLVGAIYRKVHLSVNRSVYNYKEISPFSIAALSKSGVTSDYPMGLAETKNHSNADLAICI